MSRKEDPMAIPQMKLKYKINAAGTVAYVDEKEAVKSAQLTYRYLRALAENQQSANKVKQTILADKDVSAAQDLIKKYRERLEHSPGKLTLSHQYSMRLLLTENGEIFMNLGKILDIAEAANSPEGDPTDASN